ncbi:universal stress protein [Streptomyces sp. NPDC002928]|uniref:universal stress protein n=1 Tax=Streptomyces sp. NPDC002928 TaxID=3154440 RepID=UPI0033A65AC7
MVRTVVVGLDGSPEGRAAAEWAAREAKLRGLPLKLVHVREPVPDPMAQAPLLGAETQQHWSERIPRETAEGIELRHPGVAVVAEQLHGRPADVLTDAAKDAELLVLGSRGLSGIGGFVVGSVGMAVVAHAEQPVALVRAGEQAADEHETDPAGIPSAATGYRPVVLGLDAGSPDDTVIEFAFRHRRCPAVPWAPCVSAAPAPTHEPPTDGRSRRRPAFRGGPAHRASGGRNPSAVGSARRSRPRRRACGDGQARRRPRRNTGRGDRTALAGGRRSGSRTGRARP